MYLLYAIFLTAARSVIPGLIVGMTMYIILLFYSFKGQVSQRNLIKLISVILIVFLSFFFFFLFTGILDTSLDRFANIINDPKMRSIFDVLVAASEEGYKIVNIIVGSDRLGEFESLAMKYNGDIYNFDEIKTISAGPRDDEAEGVGGVSSSKQRKAVMDDDFAAFKRGLPKTVKDADAQALFDAVRTGMSVKKEKDVKESYDLWEIAPKSDPRGLRDNYVKRKIFNIGDLVENLNTGLVGRIMRRGTNYLICVTEQDNMFKSWIHDVTEAVRPANKTGRYGVPSPQREVGTDAYREYAQSMVPGQETIRNFINKYKAKR